MSWLRTWKRLQTLASDAVAPEHVSYIHSVATCLQIAHTVSAEEWGGINHAKARLKPARAHRYVSPETPPFLPVPQGKGKRCATVCATVCPSKCLRLHHALPTR